MSSAAAPPSAALTQLLTASSSDLLQPTSTNPQLSQLTRKSQQVRRRRCTGRLKLSRSHKFETCNHTGGTRAQRGVHHHKRPQPDTHPRSASRARPTCSSGCCAAFSGPFASFAEVMAAERRRGERERRGEESGGRRGGEAGSCESSDSEMPKLREGLAGGGQDVGAQSARRAWRMRRMWEDRCAPSDGVVTAHTHTHYSNSHRFPNIAALRSLMRNGGW